MPVTADQVTIAQKHEPEANCDLVTSITVNPGATFDLSTPVGQNDNRMVVGEVRTYLVGGSNTLESVAGAIELRASSVGSTELAAGAVTTPAIADNNVTQAKLAPLCVGTPELIDANVTQSKMASDSVATAALVDANVTLAKLATEVTDRFITTEQQGKLDDTIWVTDARFAGGADPTGVADSGPAIQAAIDYAVQSGTPTIIKFPKGTYLITTTVVLPRDSSGVVRRLTIDFGNSWVKCNSDIVMFSREISTIDDTQTSYWPMTFKNGTLLNTDTPGNGTAFRIHKVANLLIENMRGQSLRTFCDLAFCLEHQVQNVNCTGCQNTFIVQDGIGIFTDGVGGELPVKSAQSNLGTWINVRTQQSTLNSIGFDIRCSGGITLIGCGVEGTQARTAYRFSGLQVADTAKTFDLLKHQLINCWLEFDSVSGSLDQAFELNHYFASSIDLHMNGWTQPDGAFIMKLTGDCRRSVINWYTTELFNGQLANKPWFDANISATLADRNMWNFYSIPLNENSNFEEPAKWEPGVNGQVPTVFERTYQVNAGTYYDTHMTLPGNGFLANLDVTEALAKPYTQGSSPQSSRVAGATVLGFDATGNIAEFDARVTAQSRKNGVDVVAFAPILAIDFDAGNYDNKEVVLTDDVVDITLTATRQTDYELRFRQDATGFRDVFAVTTNISPNIKQVLLAPDSNQVSVWRLYYDGTTFHWG